jgi:hypothetical protein
MKLKTLLTTMDMGILDNAKHELFVYLLIQEEGKKIGMFNAIGIYIKEYPSLQTYHFGRNYSLQGGHSLTNMNKFFAQLGDIQKSKQISISVIPRIVSTELLKKFELLDSGVDFIYIMNNSTNLRDFRSEEFAEIYDRLTLILRQNGISIP